MPANQIIGGLLGGLLGGGSQTTQNTTNTLANTNTFNPNIVFGGDSTFNPSSPLANDFIASASSSQSQEQADPADLLSALSPVSDAGAILGGIAPLVSSAAGVSSGAAQSAFLPTSDPLASPSIPSTGLLIAGAAVVAAAVFIPRKKRGR